MYKISSIKDFNNILNIESLTILVQKQFESYGVNKTSDEILLSLQNALTSKSRSVLFLLQAEDDKDIGFAFCNINSGLESGGDYIWINELYISDEYRALGFGKKIISYIESWCKEHNLVYIACSTGEQNSVAQNFYKKLGYHISKTIWVDKSI